MATLASMTVRLGIDTDRLNEGIESAKARLATLGKAVAGLGVGVPAAAAVATAVGGMAAAFASAGVAAKAFQLAVGPQMQAVTEVSDLATEAQKAAAEGAEDATEKQKAYTDALNRLPPATRAMAKEFIGLKKDHQAWSDSLSKTTMPVFTKGLQVIRRLLPALTPFVKAAASALGEFVDEIDRSTRGKGLQAFAQSMAQIAGDNLKSLLSGLRNIAVGIGGIIAAFLPVSTQMSGGFEEMTASFARWGQALGDSAGFAQFLQLARSGGTTLGNLAGAAVNLLVAVAPLLGTTTELINLLARLVSAVPTPVLTALATTLIAVKVAMLGHAAATKVAAVANRLFASSAWAAIAGWARMLAFGIAAYARLAAAAVASAARTAAAWAGAALRSMATFAAQMIRTAAVAVAQFVMMAARAVAWAAVMAAQWLIAMGPVGWVIAAVIALVALIVANWDRVKAITAAVWGWIWGKIQAVATGIRNAVILAAVAIYNGWVKANNAIRSAVSAAWSWILGKISAVMTGAKNAVLSGIARIGNAFLSIHRTAASALAGAGRWLINAGRNIIRGLINGITSMLGSLRSKLSSITSMIPDWKGPETVDRKLLIPAGQSVMAGFQSGIAAQVPALRDQLRAVTGDLPGMALAVPRGVTRQAGQGPGGLVIDVRGGDEDLIRLIRKWVRRQGGGNAGDFFSQ